MAKAKKKLMTALEAHSLRDLIEAVNEDGIQKDDIVSLNKSGDGYTLIYYYEEV